MSIVTINLLNKHFQLACGAESEKQLLTLAEELNNSLSLMKAANPSASFELLLVMAALSGQDRITALESKLSLSGEEGEQQYNQEFAETLSTIASYLENLAHKMTK